jgi:hypothetical protein
VRVLGGLVWVGIQIPCLRIYRGSMLVIFNSETEGDGAQGIVRVIGNMRGDCGMRSEFQYLEAAEFTIS